ncbi:MFS transporter [Pediococcus pentosaceus]|uniref:MFS transporter n=1 Tax=Pediococcus pentosaceus TaxID=1255 RepID=UPI00235F9BC8|nr:MFS transporter [Pediococcus pentosaceus]MDD1387001.1 MFS transporter [Pediococcus pentosaceus]
MKKRQIAILLAMALGIFLCMLDTTIMNIALPVMQTGLRTDLNTLQWALNVYTITFASLTIPLGRIGDQLGKNKIYLLGLILFLMGSLISGLSTYVGMLIVGRGIQSVGAAIVFPASMTIGINAFELSRRNMAVLVLGITQGLAAALGPTIGGIVTQIWGWRSIFFINIPVVVISIVLCVLLLPLKHEKTIHTNLDITGMLLSIVTLFSLVLALVKGSDWNWSSWKIVGLFIIFGLSIGLFIWNESKISNPMIRLDLFKYRHFVGSVMITVFSGIFFVGVLVLMPSFFTKVQGYTEFKVALMITPASVMVFIFSPISGLLLEKIGSRLLITLGITIMALGYVGLSMMNPAIYWQLVIACILVGMGYGIIIGPITVLSAGNFTGELLTASQSVIGVFRQIGTVLAVAIFVSIFSTNLGIAKKQVWHSAEKQVQQLSVAQSIKKETLKHTYHDLYQTEKVSSRKQTAISSKMKKRLSDAQAKQYFSSHQGLSSSVKRTIYNKISLSVSHKVKLINHQIRQYQHSITKVVNQKITQAFMRPYQIAMPLVWLMLVVVFVFEKRNTW